MASAPARSCPNLELCVTDVVAAGNLHQRLALSALDRLGLLVRRELRLASIFTRAPSPAPALSGSDADTVRSNSASPPSTVSISRPCEPWCRPMCRPRIETRPSCP